MFFATPSPTTATTYSATQALLSNTFPQRLCATPFSNISAQHSPPTLLCSTLLHNTLFQKTLVHFQHSLQNLPPTLIYNTLLQRLLQHSFPRCLRHFSTALQRFNNALLQHFFTALLAHNSLLQTSVQHSSPTSLYYTLLRHFFKAALQHSSPNRLYTLLQHFSTTLFSNSLLQNVLLPHFSTQHSSPTLLYNTLLTSPTLLHTLVQHFSTLFSNAVLQHSPLTLFYNSLLRHFSPTPFCNLSLPSASATLLRSSEEFRQRSSTTLLSHTSPQNSSPNLLHNTLCNTSLTFLQQFYQSFSTTTFLLANCVAEKCWGRVW